jgi:serine/threonine-protein kinase
VPPSPEKPLIDGRYERISVLGEGTTATVYRVRDVQTGEARAIKMLSPRLAVHEAVRDRFAQEASVTARLRHPNVVKVHGTGEHEGTPYIVMDYVRGGTLKERVEERGPLPPRIASAVLQQALHALHHAHAEGIVHRDVKPNNVMITADGTPRVVDFGIGRATGRDPRFVTDPGSVLGTFGYMAPEQSIDSADVDNRADIYAAGATLYAVVTGRRPGELYRADEDPALLASVPVPLRPIIKKATRYQPDDRYRTAAEMAKDLLDAHLELPPVSTEEEATLFLTPVATNTQVIRQQIDLSDIAAPEKAAAERRRRRREGREAKIAREAEASPSLLKREVPLWGVLLVVLACIIAMIVWALVA